MNKVRAMQIASKGAQDKIALLYSNPRCVEAESEYYKEVLRHYLNITAPNSQSLFSIALETNNDKG
jgi:hypothetical protein